MKLFYFWVCLFVSLSALAEEITGVNVARYLNEREESLVRIPFGELENVILKEVWRSPGGIVCKISLYGVVQLQGTFECESKEGYKAQIGVNCLENLSKESSAYLFFGLVGESQNVGNFYIWCN
ncbi:hypothetical protein EUZ85_18315 [Hahella sp. KA22]|uniref:hypothetical protein n=1 Tax=Hahella sp. KA22 TaxID=1628392 RepID=UPI000FDDE9DB|nr:hypothetical protein [Hahella sp. KA22]AZZ92571.1 hypothetical protein ENC22_15740 [Hahella sp. KA22]QAY55944.1 hypothetical protein EUZ85_18315 [Hahella sp. KA22]